MCGSMADIQYATVENRRGKKNKKIKKETTAAEQNGGYNQHFSGLQPT